MRQFPAIDIDDDDEIECFAQFNPGRPGGDPIVAFRPKGLSRYEQTVSLMFGWEGLRRLRDKADRLLREHDELFGRGGVVPAAAAGGGGRHRPVEDCGNCEPGVVPAEAATGAEELPEGWQRKGEALIHWKASVFQSSNPTRGYCCNHENYPVSYHPTESAALAAAQAMIAQAKGATIDPDDLLRSMADGFEPRISDEDDPRPPLDQQRISDILGSTMHMIARPGFGKAPTDAEIAAGVRNAPRSVP